MRTIKIQIMAGLCLSLVTQAVSANTLDQFSKDLQFAKQSLELLQQEDVAAKKESAREDSPELFPAFEGAKPVLTIAQQNLIRRCDRIKTPTPRCAVIKCRLIGENCKR